MSSTGRLSKVISSGTTALGENSRKANIEHMASPSMFETVRQVEGVISKVHGEKLLVKAYDAKDGSTLAGNKWIPLLHSPQEVAERFGTIRSGMVVMVRYHGPGGANATATIVFNEKEGTGTEDFTTNELQTGLFEIFKPGM